MKLLRLAMLGLTAAVFVLPVLAEPTEAGSFKDLFNGKDLTGWVDVNTSPDTWRVEDGLLICKGQPIGVMRSERQYENFILHVEWRHMEAGGNSGCFIWSEGTVPEGKRLPKGMEVQMLELEWPFINRKPDGTPNPIAYVHGELFGANGLTTVPDNPRGSRSKSIENRCLGKGEWNYYDVGGGRRHREALRQWQVCEWRPKRLREERLPLPGVRRRGNPLPQDPDPGIATGCHFRGADGAGGKGVGVRFSAYRRCSAPLLPSFRLGRLPYS